MPTPISIVVSSPVPVAAVVVRTTFADLAAETRRCHDLLRRAAAEGRFTPDGTTIALYRRLGADGSVEASIGMRVTEPFEDTGSVRCIYTPTGRAASTVHTGSLRGLPAAHTAILEWADEAGAELAGVSWEVHGPPTADPSQPQTEVFHLLAIEPSVIDY